MGRLIQILPLQVKVFRLEMERMLFRAACLQSSYRQAPRLPFRSSHDPDEGSINAPKLNLVDSVDRERADFIQKYFKVEWPDRAIYHTMLNTAIGDEAAVSMILSLLQTVPAQDTLGKSIELRR